MKTIPFPEALGRMLAAAVPIDRVERVAIEEAAGRVAAAPVTALADVPPFARAAMDGYAVVAADTSGASRTEPRALRCLGRVYTGSAADAPVAPGACMAIATGAPVPEGADAVIMIEDTAPADGSEVRLLAAVRPGQNIAPRGSDLGAGTRVLNEGEYLSPARVGALAATGVTAVDVYAKPVVAIASTGPEVVEPGSPLRGAQIYDINRYTLAAVIRAHGGVPRALRTPGDSRGELEGMLGEAAAADVLVVSGGSSVGEKDLVVDVIASAGEVVFHGIAIKPGKPTGFGCVRGTPVLMMPGNPTSCLSNAYLLLKPFLRRTARLPSSTPHTVRAPLARRIDSGAGRHQFFTVRLEDGRAVPAFKSSSAITSMSQADGYIEIPADVATLEAGQMVDVTLFE